MVNTEPKRRSVPGARELVLQVRSISDSIQSIEDEIKANIDKLGAIMEANRANSKKAGLLADYKHLNDEIQELRMTKKAYFDQLNSCKDSIERLKENSTKDRNSIQVRNPEELERRIESLNMRLIAESISANEEKKIAAELQQLRSMKAKLGDIEESRNRIRDIEASLKEAKAKIGEVSQKIAEMTMKKDLVKAELDKASAADRVKSPEVVRIESRIAGLKAQKQDMVAQKNAKKDAIRALEAEWVAFEEVLVEQRNLEERKDAIRRVIQECRNRKDALASEISDFDPKVFDMLHYSVCSLKDAKVFSLDISLVDLLLKHGVKVPSNAGEAEETLEQLEAKKSGSASFFRNWREKIGREIAGLDSKILAESEKLSQLPPTDYDILKKGGRVRKV